jgi:hypothetical protein
VTTILRLAPSSWNVLDIALWQPPLRTVEGLYSFQRFMSY